MKVPLVDLKIQYQEVKKEIDRRVFRVLQKGNFILGSEVLEFEHAFSKYCGAKYCLGVASGYDAITLALRALNIGSGDEVITVANTFIASVFPIIEVGAKPRLVDIDPGSLLMNVKQVEETISKKTKAIIPVHLFGRPCPMETIREIAKKHKLFIIEDAAQAHGSTIRGKKCGTFGEIGAFSFYPGKNLGAAGDAGAIITNSKTLFLKIKAMRDVGQVEKYKHAYFGQNSRLDTIQAAILLAKLKKLDQWNRNRTRAAALYRKYLAIKEVTTIDAMPFPYRENFHLYVVRVKERNKLKEYLEKRGIYCGIHYPIPVHLQKSLKFLGYQKGDFPVAEKYATQILSLPIYPGISQNKIKYVCQHIKNFYEKK